MEYYKQKYEQAMLRMTKWVEGSEIIDPKEVAEFVFPELKESGDERIRKWLIRLINTAGYRELDTDKMPCSRASVVAWLEKQGEHQEYPKDVIDNAISFLANRNDGMPEEEAKDIVNAIITVLNPCYWPKRVEQKPADKVEPEPYFYCKYGGTIPCGFFYNLPNTKSSSAETPQA